MTEKTNKMSSKMAEVVALIRALESEKNENERICYDQYAIHFVNPEVREFMIKNPKKFKAENEKMNKSLPGYSNSTVARARYFDDIVKSSVNNGIEQLIILGAGYDTKAYRIEGLDKIKVFEVDTPHTITMKKDKIKEIFGLLHDHVIYVSADLEVEKLGQVLMKEGYDKHKKTLFVLEGLIYYLSPETVDDLLSFIVQNSPKSSSIVFDYGNVKPDNSTNEGTKGYKFAKQQEKL